MKKILSRYWLILLIVTIILLSLYSIYFLKSARETRTWPFNSGLSNYLPYSVTNFVYSFTTPKETIVSSAYNKIKINYYPIPSSSAIGHGGGVNTIGKDSVLVSLNNGEIFIFNFKNKNFNKIGNDIQNKYFSIRDIYLHVEKKKFLVLATVQKQNICQSIQFDSYDYDFSNQIFRISNPIKLWESETECDTPYWPIYTSGGRIIYYKNNYYLSTGYFSEKSFSYLEPGMHPHPQSKNSSFGKILKINDQNESEIYSMGHRVPQGLFVSKSKDLLISTEHGPKGGDEVNIINKNNNYGWPCKTLGTMYGYPEAFDVFKQQDKKWPTDLEELGCDYTASFTDPLFSWASSIAISQGFEYEGSYFNGFNENLIIGSLYGLSLFRLVMSDDKKIISSERIRINERIRDLTQTQDGKILLYTDGGDLLLLSTD